MLMCKSFFEPVFCREYCGLGCDAVRSDKNLPTFWGIAVSPHSSCCLLGLLCSPESAVSVLLRNVGAVVQTKQDFISEGSILVSLSCDSLRSNSIFYL
jgi:hypothetical protein